MSKPLPFNLYNTLHNLLVTYSYSHEEVLVLEAVANGIDAKAKDIWITFERSGDNRYIIFQNNGNGMNDKEFENYHTISSSTKTKGKGIGFAGVGAKIFLGAKGGSEIITITSTNGKILSSRMYREGEDVKYETSIEVGLNKKVGSSKTMSFNGTIYKVRVNEDGFQFLKKQIKKILQFWFNYAITTQSQKFYVDEKRVEPWKPNGKCVRKVVDYKGSKIICYFWISEKDIPEDNRHMVYSVYGKRIKNEQVDFAYQIIGDKNNKVFGIADVSVMADELTTGKEDFIKSKRSYAIRNKIKNEFKEFLKSEGLIRQDSESNSSISITSNELTRRLDRLLHSKEFQFLNPWISPRNKIVATPHNDGNILIQVVEGGQIALGTDSFGGTGGIPTIGDEDKIGYDESEEGERTGKAERRRAMGLQIVNINDPNDPREGWVSDEAKGVVYNTGHSFSQNFIQTSLFAYNQLRVVISVLIDRACERSELDGKTAIDILAKVLHGVW